MVQQARCFVSNKEKEYQRKHPSSTFDSDSVLIMFDDGGSASITNDCNDIIQKPRGIKCKVKGIAGSDQATLCGTVQWYLDDVRDILINS